MADTVLDLKTVAVIGAGVSGVCAAIQLKRAGLDVTVYERSSRAGGVWVYDERTSLDPAYPSILPSTGDSPEFERFARHSNDGRRDSPLGTPVPDDAIRKADLNDTLPLRFAPPGPAYVALKNNVSTIEMELSCQKWKSGTEEFVPHYFLGDYIQDAAAANGILESVSFNTRVDQVEKYRNKWRLDISKVVSKHHESLVAKDNKMFDAVLVASGHYHACNVPDIPGLTDWKSSFPDRVQHSKLYRRPEKFKGQNVLLIGSGVSSTDIARDLGPHAGAVIQSSRGGLYDLPSHLLPDNGARVDGIERFDMPESLKLASDGSIAATVTLRSGQKLCNIHHVILCTGYHVSFPFMRQYHRDGMQPEDADEEALSTNGQVTHNLHKDIWYINDPSLAFIGVPYHVATFSLFEFQAMALAQVFAGRVALPSTAAMRTEYNDRVQRKGAGRTLHSLKARGDEIAYVQDLVAMVNGDRARRSGESLMSGHSDKWLEAYVRRGQRQAALFSKVRDPQLDERTLWSLGC